MEASTRVCRKCEQSLPLMDFYKNKRGRDGLHSICKRCHKAYMRNRHTTTTFGVSTEQYNELLAKQQNRCAICVEENGAPLLAIDHNHKTGEIRGLLCADCNAGLGRFHDNTLYLERAMDYLQERGNYRTW